MSNPSPSVVEATASRVQIDAVVSEKVTFAFFTNGDKPVREVSITNRGDAALSGGRIVVRWQRDGSDVLEFPFGRLEPDSTLTIAPTLSLSLAHLASQTETEVTALVVRVETDAGSHEKTFPVELVPFDHWPGTTAPLELLASFVTPNHERIAELLNIARPQLERLSGRSSFDGYQSNSRQRVVDIAHACGCAVQGLSVGYAPPPPSFERLGQRLRFADRVLRDRLGSCLDLSLLLASMWECAGLRPVLMLIEGHAMCGFWTKPGVLAEPVHDDPAHIRNLVKLGDIVVYESTLIIQGGTSQDEWVKAASGKLDNPGNFFACVDVASARRSGARPLPLRNAGEVAEIDLDRVKAAESTRSALDAVTTADRESGPQATNAAVDLPSRRVAEWQLKLLDLTLHNRLINLKQTSKTLQLNVPDLAEFEDGLWNEKRFVIKPQATVDDASLRTRLADGIVHTKQSPAETSNALLSLYREHRVAMEESGANPLFVTLGQLKWYESDASEQPRFAPLLLLPAQLVRHGDGGGYRYELQMTDEPVRVNVTLLEKLRMEFGLDVSPLGVIPEDENGVDVPLLMRRAREVIRGMKRWEVIDASTLGMFSFSKFLMWRDLQEHLETLRRNRLVNHLLEKPGQDLPNPPFANAETLDDDVPADDLFCTRDADSSQLAAIRSASQGVSFVLEGPPGSGKSQTIANVVADSIARGKRVLFVAEKMAALTVVRDRLEKDGLGAFCLELHSAKASKREILAQLERAMGARSLPITDRWRSECTALTRERDALNAYVRELHKPRRSGETLHQVLGRLSRLGDGPAATPQLNEMSATSEATLTALRALVREVATMAAPVDPVREHLLREVTRRTASMTLRDEVRAATDDATAALNQLRSSLELLLSAINANVPLADISRRGISALASCAETLDNATPMPLALTSSADASTNIAACRDYVALGREVEAERSRLLQIYREELLDSDVLPLLDLVRVAASKRGILSYFARRTARNRLRPYCRNQPPELQAAVQDMELIAVLRRKTAALRSQENVRNCLGIGHATRSWDELQVIIDRCSRLQAIFAAFSDDEDTIRIARCFAAAAADFGRRAMLVKATATFTTTMGAWMQAWGRLDGLLGVAACETDDLAVAPAWFNAMGARIARWQSGVSSLRDWCAWQDVRARAVDAGLSSLIALHEHGAARSALSDAFERGFGRVWFNSVADTIPAIRDFTEQSHTARIQRFREHDRHVTALTPLDLPPRFVPKSMSVVC